MNALEEIRQQAALVIQRPDDTEVGEAYASLIAACDDREGLEGLAERLAFYPEAAVPLVRRLIDFDPADTALVLRLGFIHFTGGEDEAAAQCLERAKSMEGETARVLHFEAALARDNAEKKRLYTRILELAPKDRQAFQHLLGLR